ncbi:bis(5'-nucleosyl)-tetraphosphatase (symmetrical) YqeK [Allobacillus halotolerans]|uniref:bis(5'-nucleosyl)-tetraphosphatase (symmetrical) n=1 Tax=Allobacillus halotolerans TaxID=570278 RepID=A0ABS6GNI9_9BACI|nr:bis(5'-nucleosyl)-tetraphosphatase (symmetrical) YqeK [Allobacillus halotolerans]MBU6080691.1 bis(5'-nucleosyl)-tetraphosphatase (symmetrical) YqeK [Allobacillus halotolerans]
MNVEMALAESKKVLSSKRQAHVERVTEEALQLAKLYHADQEQVGIAAALHDYAKEFDKAFLTKTIESSVHLPKDLLLFNEELLHGPAGAELIRRKFNIEEKNILHSIRYHTTGRARMSLEEKIVFLADYIEPGRDFPAVYKVRELATEDLNEACRYSLRETIQFLMSKNQLIYPDTFHAYNELTKK